MDVSILSTYFSLSQKQISLYQEFADMFYEKNMQLNMVSKKDAPNLVERHILHSMAIGLHFDLAKNSVLDVGTGGGFPGLPLAILFPEAQFTLIDARAKKITAVKKFIKQLGLANVTAMHIRAEELKGNFDFIVSRAVTNLADFTRWVPRLIKPGFVDGQAKGIIYLRGMDFSFDDINDEISDHFDCNRIIHLNKTFDLDFFSSKKVVFLQRL